MASSRLMWATRKSRQGVALALIERLPEWPAPDMLEECCRALVIAWELGKEIVGCVVGEQMISVFWAGFQGSAETPEAAAEMLSGHLKPAGNEMVNPQLRSIQSPPFQFIPSTWEPATRPLATKRTR